MVSENLDELKVSESAKGSRPLRLNLFDFPLYLPVGGDMRSRMTAIARVFSKVFPLKASEADVLKELLLLALAGLFVSALLMTYGLDLSPGFF